MREVQPARKTPGVRYSEGDRYSQARPRSGVEAAECSINNVKGKAVRHVGMLRQPYQNLRPRKKLRFQREAVRGNGAVYKRIFLQCSSDSLWMDSVKAVTEEAARKPYGATQSSSESRRTNKHFLDAFCYKR